MIDCDWFHVTKTGNRNGPIRNDYSLFGFMQSRAQKWGIRTVSRKSFDF